MAGEEDDRRRGFVAGQTLLEIETAQARHPEIDDEAAGFGTVPGVEEAPGGIERTRGKPLRAHEQRDRIAQGRVVVDHEDHRLFPHVSSVAHGSSSTKRAPPPSFASARKRPP